MCGIVGYIGKKFADAVLLVDLERLEYRGYDSAGLATVARGKLIVRRRPGRLTALDRSVRDNPLGGSVGIGHTRWATHGEPTEVNAHPHTDCTGKIAVVHNGIVENYQELKQELIDEGHVFKSETDTEVIPHLIEKYYEGNLVEAVRKAAARLDGHFAFVTLSEMHPDELVAARRGSPLLVGLGEGENFLASDLPALIQHTRRFLVVEDGELAVVRRDGVKLTGESGEPIERTPHTSDMASHILHKNGYKHYMLKEIHEQPEAIERLLEAYVGPDGLVRFENLSLDNQMLAAVKRIFIQACGTSWHAGLVGKRHMESLAGVITEVDISSEFRYRNPLLEGDTMVVGISQSGETADTLAGIRQAKSKFVKVLSLCNVITSTIARESDAVLDMHAGPEIGVASTKAYTCELVLLYLLTLHMARVHWAIDDETHRACVQTLAGLPEKMRRMLNDGDVIQQCAERFHTSENFVFLGRGFNHPTALEGALKLKEISYIHATGYPAGEFKHGPIALVDAGLPVVCIATKSSVYQKMLSNIQEVRSRNGRIIAVATEGDLEVPELAEMTLFVPDCPEELSPILSVVPLQLLAYHIAVLRGCDVDKPRNLAKSVTVE